MSDLTLILGSKAYSSWSLRPWLALKQTGLPFAELVIPLRQPDTRARILEHSPAGKVPVLRHGDLTVWDSLAICEYVAELAPEAALWPADPAARAIARAVSAEMHAGFQALRSSMPMDLKRRAPGEGMTDATATDIARITALWADCRARFGEGGPFLFGRFSIADAMYAPVVTRFDTYAVALDSTARAYADAVLALPAMRDWTDAGRAEPWTIDFGGPKP
ncbi:glutathione S-transferase family protein [Azospirillum sp. RWY-5-1]|uniref:Glutathione S-transferase family protein n=1 Tax=Azospirillum oleiclasticum TaxID=2735135 RepID=A0ABX2TJF0_9PROT|nr:glutathione S-transferase family protein [Azospirillum oleiclasticum]NYZ17250.1 glutathione S-transferase family protein [Azospirillum oleiclasticum]NYZ23466.1 glutathione S-transferase family protein [Azospirillum oleiclasticum]